MRKDTIEKWLPVVGYESTHEVSNLGRVRRIMLYGKPVCRYLSHSISHSGYRRVMLSDGDRTRIYQVHRVVASAFILNPNNLPQINHKNGDKSDNRVENLEWVTAKENVAHSIRTGLRKPADECFHTKIHKDQLCKLYGLRRLGFTYSAIGEILGVSKETISARYRRNDYLAYFGEQEFENMVADYINKIRGKYTPIDKRKFLKGGAKKRVIQMDKSGNIVGRFDSETEAAKAAGVCMSAVGHNLHGKSKYCMGYKYVYE